MAPAQSPFAGCGSSPFGNDCNSSAFYVHPARQDSCQGASSQACSPWAKQRKAMMPLKQRKGYFDSAEFFMAMEKGEPLETLPPAPARSARSSLERQRSRLSQCTYATNVCATDVFASALYADNASSAQ